MEMIKNKVEVSQNLKGNHEAHKKLMTVMYMGKPCMSVPADAKEVWIFRGHEHFIISLPENKKK